MQWNHKGEPAEKEIVRFAADTVGEPVKETENRRRGKGSDDVGGQRHRRRRRRHGVGAGRLGAEMGDLWIREGVLIGGRRAAVKEDGKVHRDLAVLRVCVWRACGGGSVADWHAGVGLEVGFRVGDVGGTECMLLLLLLLLLLSSLSESLFGRALAEE
jgi:hypothetical protein